MDAASPEVLEKTPMRPSSRSPAFTSEDSLVAASFRYTMRNGRLNSFTARPSSIPESISDASNLEIEKDAGASFSPYEYGLVVEEEQIATTAPTSSQPRMHDASPNSDSFSLKNVALPREGSPASHSPDATPLGPGSASTTSSTANLALELLIERIRSGVEATEEELTQFASFFLVQDATALDYLAKQDMDLPSSQESAQTQEKDKLIVVTSETNDDKYCLAVTHPAFVELLRKLRFSNVSGAPLSISVLTFASQGAFLGFRLSRSVLRQNEDVLLSLHLVGTAIGPTTSLAIVSVSAAANSPINLSQETAIQAKFRYFCFFSRITMIPSPTISTWQFRIHDLVEYPGLTLVSNSVLSVHRANLLGCDVCQVIFKPSRSLGDAALQEKFISILSNSKLTHDSLPSLIGASTARPFRILTERWDCTLTASLLATLQENVQTHGLWTHLSQLALSTASSTSTLSTTTGSPSSSLFSTTTTSDGLFTQSLFFAFARRIWHKYAQGSMSLGPNTEVRALSLTERLFLARDLVSFSALLHSENLLLREFGTQFIGMTRNGVAMFVDLSKIEAVAAPWTARSGPASSWVAPELSHQNSYLPPSDVYAAGVVLLDLILGAPLSYKLGGQRLIEFDALLYLLEAHLSDNIEETPSIASMDTVSTTEDEQESLAMQLLALVKRCCHKDPSLRPTMNTLAAALDEIIERLELEDAA